MPDKQDRQVKHIKDSYLERGASEEKAERIAHATVNKQRGLKGGRVGRKKKKAAM